MITLLWKSLRYDIEQQTYRLAEMRMADHPEQKDGAEIDDSESLGDMALRWCEGANASLAALMKDRIESSESMVGYDDALDYEKVKWEYRLKEGGFIAGEEVLCKLMHDYVVAFVLAQWALMFAPNETAAFSTRMDDAMMKVNDYAYALGTPKKARKTVEKFVSSVELVNG